MHWGGATRISVEVTVMVMERRGCVKSLALMYNWKQDDILVTIKPFNIPKQLVWQAYKLVRANAGSAGIDNQSIDEFSQDLKGNLYKLWNRMSSGSYFPPAVKEVAIPKKQGGVRKLGIPTVADRIAQMTVKLMMEPLLEPHFLDDSYGYRPNKSALDAVGVTRKRCWEYDWVVEFDIKGLFDNLSHKLLMKAVKHHISDRWILLYVERWLTAPIQDQHGGCLPRTAGTPQGGVISPLLSNLFLHYAFDHWMTKHHADNPWCRYADDGLAHCRTQKEAGQILKEIDERFKSLGLEIHPDKTKIVYCKDGARKGKYKNKSFDFLGYTFKARRVKVRSRNSFFIGFTPVVSLKAVKAMTLKLRRGNWRNNTSLSLQELADFINPMLRGWLAYYGKYSRSSMYRVWRCVNNMLLAWTKKKYKSLGRSRTKAGKLMERIHKEKPALFVHWREGMFGALT
ncbi:TPA: group II intron reverse transcriptase/maturase [Legionella pneumophila]